MAIMMRIPDWRKLVFDAGVLPETVPEGGRIVLWLPSGREGGCQQWERIGTVARAEVTTEQGVCATAATSIRARQLTRGFFRNLFQRFRDANGDHVWELPNGQSAEQRGEMHTDLLLVWAEDDTVILDEARIRSRWVQAQRIKKIASNLFLVSGVEQSGASGVPEQAPPLGCPRAQGEQLLATARAAGDRR